MDDEDKRTKIYDHEGKDTPLPLNIPKIAVSRINRKIVVALLLLFGSLTALSLIWAISPGKTPIENKAKPEDSAGRTPILPDNVIDSPSSYRELARERKTGQQGSSSPGVMDSGKKQLDAGRSLQDAADGKPAYVAYPASSNQASLTPGQQVAKEAAEQRRKDYNEALRAPLTFGGQSGSTDRPLLQQVEPAAFTQGKELDALTRKLTSGGDDDQNKQEEKRSFSRETRGENPYLLATLQNPISRYEIKAGTIIPSLLLTGLNSDLPGQIAAQVRENVYDTATGRYLLIPQGTRLVGEYDSKVAYGQDRALIVWSRLIMPNGNSINLEGMPGVDMSGYSGLSDRVNNHYAKLVTGVILGSVLGAGAQVATGGQGTAYNAPSFSQQAVSGGAQNLNQAGQQITQRNLNLQPTIEVRPGLKLNVFVTKDIILKPYRM